MATWDYEDHWVNKARILIKAPENQFSEHIKIGNSYYELPVQEITGRAQIYSCICMPRKGFPTVQLWRDPLFRQNRLEIGRDYVGQIIIPETVSEIEKFYSDGKIKVNVSRFGFENTTRPAWLGLRNLPGIFGKIFGKVNYLEGVDGLFRNR